MKKNVWAWIVVGIFASENLSAQMIEGYVRNKWAQPVPNASLQFTSLSSGKTFTARSDANGFYRLNLPFFEKESENRPFVVFDVFPNPFSRETNYIIYALRPVRANVSVINRIGQVVRQLHNGPLKEEYNYFTWDGRDQTGAEVPEGMYIIQITSGKTIIAKKVLKLSNAPSGGSGAGNLDPEVLFENVMASYQVTIEAQGYKKHQHPRLVPQGKTTHNWVLFKEDTLPFKTVDHYLAIRQPDDQHKPFFINGINLGIATPGTNPGNLAATKEEYRRWLQLIWEAGFNSIRTYTIHFPRFYEVLDEFNRDHIERPLWLVQGIWLDDEEITGNLYDKTEEYEGDIEEVIDAMHGNRTIPERKGRASGTYSIDVSNWILAWMLGREVSPDEVIITDSLNAHIRFYKGDFVEIEDSASPSEAWFTRMIDHAAKWEKEKYNVERPIGNSSWPTLDPLHHPTELPELSDEDIAQIDLKRLKHVRFQGGYFASYHAYPYYPDFISMEPDFQQFSDSYGPNSYIGYLTALKTHYGNKPLLLGEYGVPSSWGNASYAHSGMNHGGHTESEQAFYNIRMLKNIHQTHCAGGFLFAWMDEWFKTMWYTNPYGPVRERRALWHNVVSAEENFGLLAFETDSPTFKTWPSVSNPCFTLLEFDYGQNFFFIHAKLSSPLNDTDVIWFGIDTYDRNLGESILPNGQILTNSRAEFALKITKDKARLYVTEAYNPFAINIFHIDSTFAKPESVWHSTKTDGAPWDILRFTNGFREFEVDTIGHLHVRQPGDKPEINHAVIWLNPAEFLVRLPWTYILVADPSDHQVVHDFRGTLQNERRTTDGIFITAFRNSGCRLSSQDRMLWPRWDKAWPYKERLKESYFITKEENKTLDLKPF
ncbi:MAG: T9SS type A sorting domain-containing protein [Thermaurantimonas sp.]|uniref:T9SS type A sorting domain-containing protein n=1 Tax=Thermaurantimonas sp. TaxID=2681568 RepID=UPI00391CFD03